MGIVAQTFWQLPGVLRSDSPHAFAAAGPQAARITARTRWMSRMDWTARLAWYILDGQVLLLGVDHTANTTIHLGEYMRRARYRRKKYVTLLKEAAYPGSITLRLITAARTSALSMAGWKAKGCSARGGPRGGRLVRSSDVIRVVTEKIQQNETVFLHPFGVDEECDDARLSLSEE